MIALGFLRTGATQASVIKPDGASGLQIWRRDLPLLLRAQGLAVGAGDVIVAAGDSSVGSTGGDLVKLDGVSGGDVWQQPA